MTRRPFLKYHGLGNDFVVVEAHRWPDAPELARRICDRHRGVGADGLLVVDADGQSHSADDPSDAHAGMIIYNRDGSRPQMCGNGIRCVARYLLEEGRAAGDGELVIASDAGPRRCRLVDKRRGVWRIEVDMGEASVESDSASIEAAGFSADATRVDMGNPHAVVFAVPALSVIDRVGEALNDAHPDFEEGVNVEFVEVTGDQTIRVVVYERGVGRTLACGTGACAAAAAAVERGVCRLDEPVEVELPGGALRIAFDGRRVWMTGPVERVFSGRLSPDWLRARGD